MVDSDSEHAEPVVCFHKEDEDEDYGSGSEKVDILLTDMKDDGATADQDAGQPIRLKVYSRRWLVLAVVALLNNTNTMSWIAFAPVSNHVNSFYGGNSASWFSMVYMMCTIPVGFFAMWAGRRFGLRTAILLAGWSNGIGGLIRFVSSFVPIEYRFVVGITGQGIAAIAYPFIMFLPTKVAGSWFPDNQRGLATTVGVMSNPLGVLMANLISPQMVHSPEHVPLLNAFTFIPAIIAMLLATFGVNRSEPKIPPTFSASQEQMDFLPGLKACLGNKQYLILLVVMGGGIGMFNCLYTVMQSLLCASGYSNSFSGMGAALMIIGGVFGAAASGVFVDRTKKYVETMKIAMGLAVLIGLGFLQLTLHSNIGYLIIPACLLFGIIGLATYPVGLETSAECTFPVSEATSTGLIVLSGQIQSVVYVAIMTTFARPLDEDRQKVQVCTVSEEDTLNVAKDSSLSIIIFSVIATLLAVMLVFLFNPTLKRLEAEKQNRANKDKQREIAAKDDNVSFPEQHDETLPLND